MPNLMPFSLTQASWFRLQRSGLITPFTTPEDAAHALIGIQAQVIPPAYLSLWNRTRNVHLTTLDDRLYTGRSLVKLWGQRNTLHLYPSDEWPLLYAAFKPVPTWWERRNTREGRDPGPFQDAIRRVAALMEQEGMVSRKRIRTVYPEFEEWLSVAHGLVMELVRHGEACHAQPLGSQSRFALRASWLPDLTWAPPAADEAHRALTRRYLSAYGPASPQDLAYWFGTTVAEAKRWIQALGDETLEISLDGRRCWMRSEDLDALGATPPPRSDWPPRLLYRYDPLLLGLKDKTWLIDPAHYKRVWREAAIVEAVLLVEGRLAGTWRYKRSARGITITIDPFAPLKKKVLRTLEQEAADIATFFGIPLLGFG